MTRAYVSRMVARPESGFKHGPRQSGTRIRIGYLSCDFRNHATTGLLETHDRARFEVFAYDYSNQDLSEYRQRFLNSVEHHVPIHALTINRPPSESPRIASTSCSTSSSTPVADAPVFWLSAPPPLQVALPGASRAARAAPTSTIWFRTVSSRLTVARPTTPRSSAACPTATSATTGGASSHPKRVRGTLRTSGRQDRVRRLQPVLLR